MRQKSTTPPKAEVGRTNLFGLLISYFDDPTADYRMYVLDILARQDSASLAKVILQIIDLFHVSYHGMPTCNKTIPPLRIPREERNTMFAKKGS